MNNIIFGAAGFIGTNLTMKLAENPTDTTTIVDERPEYFAHIKQMNLNNNRFEVTSFTPPPVKYVV